MTPDGALTKPQAQLVVRLLNLPDPMAVTVTEVTHIPTHENARPRTEVTIKGGTYGGHGKPEKCGSCGHEAHAPLRSATFTWTNGRFARAHTYVDTERFFRNKNHDSIADAVRRLERV